MGFLFQRNHTETPSQTIEQLVLLRILLYVLKIIQIAYTDYSLFKNCECFER